MKTLNTRSEIEAAVDTLLRAGVFRPDSFRSPLTAHDISEIATERSDSPLVRTEDGWIVVHSHETITSTSLRRIAGVLEVVPHDETARALVKMFGSALGADEFYEAVPSPAAIREALGFLGCQADREETDFTAMPDPIEPSDEEAALFAALATTIDCNLNAARLVRKLGLTGKRTWFHDKFLPHIPFVLHQKGDPIRLLGFQPDPALHRPEEGCFLGLSVSDCGSRAMIEYRVSEEAVETASFNVSSHAKEVVAGDYEEVESGIRLAFSLERKNARKMSGIGRVIRRRFPGYVSGQHAFVLLDKVAGKAIVEVCDAVDIDARQRMRALLECGFVHQLALSS